MSHKRSFTILIHIGAVSLEDADTILESFRTLAHTISRCLGIATRGEIQLDPCDACEPDDAPDSGPRSTLDRSAN